MLKGLKVALVVTRRLVDGCRGGVCRERPHGRDVRDTLVFGAAADPTSLDGALVSDGESLRVIAQIFEGLVTLKPGTTNVVPALATKWKAARRPQVWTFTLRKGVTLPRRDAVQREGRLRELRPLVQLHGAVRVRRDVVLLLHGLRRLEDGGGNAAPTNSPLYRSCRAVSDTTAVITLTAARTPRSLAALSLQSFAIQSPTALTKYGANKGTLSKDGVFRPGGTYGVPAASGRHGPVQARVVEDRRQARDRPQRRVLGPKAILRASSSGRSRTTPLACRRCRPVRSRATTSSSRRTSPTIKKNNKLKIARPAGVQRRLRDDQPERQAVRQHPRPQAVAYGLDRAGVVKSFYAGRGEVAHEFMPPQVVGYAKDVTKYPYNPDKAKRCSAQAGLTLPVEVEFWYPTDRLAAVHAGSAAELPGVRREPEQVRLQGRARRALRGAPDYVGRRAGRHRRRPQPDRVDG